MYIGYDYNELLKDWKSKINKNENLEEYFNSFEIDKLELLVSLKENKEFNSKEEIINYIINNLDSIILNAVKYMTKSIKEELVELLEEDNYYEDYPDNYYLDEYIVCYLKNICLFKVSYSRKTELSKIYTPKEIYNILMVYLKNKISIDKKINDIKLIINKYGSIDFNHLKSIYNIEKEEIMNINKIYDICNIIENYICHKKIKTLKLAIKCSNHLYNKELNDYKIYKSYEKTEKYFRQEIYEKKNAGIAVNEFLKEDIEEFLANAQIDLNDALKELEASIIIITLRDEEEVLNKVSELFIDIYKDVPKWIE